MNLSLAKFPCQIPDDGLQAPQKLRRKETPVLFRAASVIRALRFNTDWMGDRDLNYRQEQLTIKLSEERGKLDRSPLPKRTAIC